MRKDKYFLLALALGTFAAVLSACIPYPDADPSIWTVLAESTGLRPATASTPLLWRRLVSTGLSPALIGRAGLFVFAAAFFTLLWRLLVWRICASESYRNWWRLTLPAVAAVGTLLAVFSEPIWRLAQSSGPDLLTLALTLLAVDLFFAPFFMKVVPPDEEGASPRNARPAGFCQGCAFAVAGFLTVETPVALALPVLFAVGHGFLLRRVEDGRYRENPKDLCVFAAARFSGWRAFFAWCAGAALGAGLVAASGFGLPSCALGLLHDMRLSASLVGWVLWLFFALVPVALAFGLSSVLVSRVGRLEFSFGVMALVAGLVACAPVVPVDGLHYWRFLSVPTVSSPLMLALGATLSALAVGLSLAVFAYFAYHAMPADYAPRKPVAFLVSAAFAVLAAVALTGSVCPEARELRQVISDAVDETVREAEGVRWLYTDGSCDAGLALAARRRGISFETLPLSGPDAKAAQLRDWVMGDSTNLSETAVQLGFELWVRERKTPPAASGFLARTGAFPDAERGRTAAAALGERMTELSRSGAVAREDDSAVRAAFSSLLWRLSRLARLAGDGTRADALDAANGTLRHMLERMRHERTAAFLQLTDAEGLELALKRADFVEARRFAAGVLKRNADDVGANFGMGMSYLLEGKLDDAALYLERARRQKPAEPAILNNLAIVYLRKGELEKAEDFAKRALERAPQIAEIQDTVKRIREAKRK